MIAKITEIDNNDGTLTVIDGAGRRSLKIFVKYAGKTEAWTMNKVETIIKNSDRTRNIAPYWSMTAKAEATLIKALLADGGHLKVAVAVCPKCGRPMEWRPESFWGCSEFPRCKGKVLNAQRLDAPRILVAYNAQIIHGLRGDHRLAPRGKYVKIIGPTITEREEAGLRQINREIDFVRTYSQQL